MLWFIVVIGLGSAYATVPAFVYGDAHKSGDECMAAIDAARIAYGRNPLYVCVAGENQNDALDRFATKLPGSR